MKIAHTREELAREINALRNSGQYIGFVPTMGALHEGHLALVDKANSEADAVVVSIFVNPTQFAANEDLSTYPRNEAQDLQLLKPHKPAVVYLPRVEDIYPDGAASEPFDSPLCQTLEGEYRPHFFAGVATVVGRLFEQVQPDMAVFGEKDYQQLLVVKELVRQRNLGIDIIGGQTIREGDGLARSSRNAYLSEEERQVAPKLFQVLREVAGRFMRGMNAEAAKSWAFRELMDDNNGQGGFRDVDYISIRDAETFAPLNTFDKPGRVLGAAWLGKTRLIDNVDVL